MVNADWSRDDFVAWAYALRGALGDDGKAIWLRFAAQSAKATNPATAEKIWQDATRAERDGHLCSGAGTVIKIAIDEGFKLPPPPGLPAYYDGGEQDPDEARSDLEQAVVQWVKEGLAYNGKGEAPRVAIAGAVGLGKTTVTLQALAELAHGKTVHFYAPTLKLAADVVETARNKGIDAVLIRGREKNKGDPVRWPALCRKDDVATTLGRCGRNVWESLCRKEDSLGNITTCEYFHGCAYVGQFDNLEGKLVVLAHEYITLPKALIAKPVMIVVDERFHPTLIRMASLQASRVIADRPTLPRLDGGLIADLLTHDAGLALKTLAAGRTMASAGLSPERLKQDGDDRGNLGRTAGYLAGHGLCRAAEPGTAAAGDRGV